MAQNVKLRQAVNAVNLLNTIEENAEAKAQIKKEKEQEDMQQRISIIDQKINQKLEKNECSKPLGKHVVAATQEHKGCYIYDCIKDLTYVKKFFSDQCDDQIVILQLCKNMGYEKFEKGAAVMKQGDESNNKLYIILTGRVGIIIKKDTNVFAQENKDKQQKIEQQNQEKAEQSINKQLTRKQSIMVNKLRRQSTMIIQPTQQPEKTLEQIMAELGTKVNELTIGDGFGDKALTAKNIKDAKRNASIVCMQPTECIIIMRREFLQVQENFNKEALEKDRVLLIVMPFLKQISSSGTKDAFGHYFKNETFSKDTVLTKEDMIGDKVFVLVSGKVVVFKKYLNKKNIYYQDYQQMQLCEIAEPTFLGEELILYESLNNSKLPQQAVAQLQETTAAQTKTKDSKIKDILAALSASDNAANQAQQLLENSHYCYTVKAASPQVRLYSCSKIILKQKFPREVHQFLLEKYMFKEQVRVKMQEEMVQHIEQSQKSMYDNVHITLHQLSKLKNQELFGKLQVSSIDNYNKKNIRQHAERLQRNVGTTETQSRMEFNNDYMYKAKRKVEERSIKMQILTAKIDHLHSLRHEMYQLHNQNLPVDPKLEQDIARGSQDEKLLRKIKFNLCKIDDIPLSEIAGGEEEMYQNPQVNHCLDIKSPLYDQLEEKILYRKGSSSSAEESLQQMLLHSDSLITTPLTRNQQSAQRLKNFRSNSQEQLHPKLQKEQDEQLVQQQVVMKADEQCVGNTQLDLGYMDQIKKFNYYKLLTWGKIKAKNHPPKYSKKITAEENMLKQVQNERLQFIKQDEQHSVDGKRLLQTKSYEQFITQTASDDEQQLQKQGLFVQLGQQIHDSSADSLIIEQNMQQFNPTYFSNINQHENSANNKKKNISSIEHKQQISHVFPDPTITMPSTNTFSKIHSVQFSRGQQYSSQSHATTSNFRKTFDYSQLKCSSGQLRSKQSTPPPVHSKEQQQQLQHLRQEQHSSQSPQSSQATTFKIKYQSARAHKKLQPVIAVPSVDSGVNLGGEIKQQKHLKKFNSADKDQDDRSQATRANKSPINVIPSCVISDPKVRSDEKDNEYKFFQKKPNSLQDVFPQTNKNHLKQFSEQPKQSGDERTHPMHQTKSSNQENSFINHYFPSAQQQLQGNKVSKTGKAEFNTHQQLSAQSKQTVSNSNWSILKDPSFFSTNKKYNFNKHLLLKQKQRSMLMLGQEFKNKQVPYLLDGRISDFQQQQEAGLLVQNNQLEINEIN